MQYLFILILLLSSLLYSAEFEVKSFEKAENDLTAIQANIKDVNDELCGQVRIFTEFADLAFESTPSPMDIKKMSGEIRIFLTPGTKYLMIRKEGFSALRYVFEQKIESGASYRLQLGTIGLKLETADVSFIIDQPETKIFIDGEDKGFAKLHKITLGNHDLKLVKFGYETVKEEIVVIAGKNRFVYSLKEADDVPIIITSEPNGAEVYCDDIKIGITPISIFYPSGEHELSLLKDGYENIREQILFVFPKTSKNYSLKEKIPVSHVVETRPKGKIQVAVLPENATMELRCPKGDVLSATGAKAFAELPAGKYKLIVRAEGFDTGVKNIELKDNEKLNISMNLEKLYDMIFVEGGSFFMGDNKWDYTKPVHKVAVSDYKMAKYEVTQKEWQLIMDSNPAEFQGDSLPVENVSWDDCQEFIRKLNIKTGKKYRLPTEAEWEYAAREGVFKTSTNYSGSSDLLIVGWVMQNSAETTHQVGQKQANRLGLFDMTGNVKEWCSDWYGDYSSEEQTNPLGATTGKHRVCRGDAYDSEENFSILSSRGGISPSKRKSNIGLRLVLPIEEETK